MTTCHDQPWRSRLHKFNNRASWRVDHCTSWWSCSAVPSPGWGSVPEYRSTTRQTPWCTLAAVALHTTVPLLACARRRTDGVHRWWRPEERPAEDCGLAAVGLDGGDLRAGAGGAAGRALARVRLPSGGRRQASGVLNRAGGPPRAGGEHRCLEEFTASIPAEAADQQQPAAAAESVAAVQTSAAAVVAALQRGDVQAAYEMSAVSSQMPLDTYKAVIVDGADYAPLSDGSLVVEWIGEPELLGSNEAKLRVRLWSSLDDDADEACSTYDFRMVHLAEGAAAAAQAGWLVKAVSKL
eukprot:COSAG02_NODE_2697_length_8213_cov_3.202736_4_plen_296_part_00